MKLVKFSVSEDEMFSSQNEAPGRPPPMPGATYASSTKKQPNHSNQHQQTNQSSQQQTDIFPNKDQAIIMDSIDETPIKDYINAVATKVSPKNIQFVSKISNNRVCMYLSTKEIADELVHTHKTINVNNNVLVIRPLITQNKRITLSNVPPIIPHNEIKKILSSYNIVPVSAISFVRVAGITEPDCTHIKSFKRQFYQQM